MTAQANRRTRNTFLAQVEAEEEALGDERSVRVRKALRAAKAAGYVQGYDTGRKNQGMDRLSCCRMLTVHAMAQGRTLREAQAWASKTYDEILENETD